MDYKAIIEEQIEVLREKQTKDEAGRSHRNDEGYCAIARTIMDLVEVARDLPGEKEENRSQSVSLETAKQKVILTIDGQKITHQLGNHDLKE